MSNTTISSDICLQLPHFATLYALTFLAFGFLITNIYMCFLVDRAHARIHTLTRKVDRLVMVVGAWRRLQIGEGRSCGEIRQEDRGFEATSS